jgi:hypothetical protein
MAHAFALKPFTRIGTANGIYTTVMTEAISMNAAA